MHMNIQYSEHTSSLAQTRQTTIAQRVRSLNADMRILRQLLHTQVPVIHRLTHTAFDRLRSWKIINMLLWSMYLFIIFLHIIVLAQIQRRVHVSAPSANMIVRNFS